MDDKLYYVESPDGHVLGPMTMMNILEGIAAGAVLEDARVCEVGQAGWTSLADMAYARDDAPSERAAEPSKPRAGSSVRKLSDDFLDERWTPQTDRARPTPPPRPASREETPRAAKRDAPAPRAASPARPEPPRRDTFEPAGEVQEWADATRALADSPGKPDHAAPDAKTFAAPAHLFQEPADAAPSDPAFAADAERPKSGDFSLSLAEADEELDAFVARHSRGHGKRRVNWVLVAAGGSVAVLAALWFAVGERFLGSANGDRTPAPAAVPGADPVEDAWRALSTGDATTALAAFRRVVEDQPENARAHHGLGLAALQSNELELATTHLERATALSPQDVRMRLDLGTARLREGRWELAVQQANQAQTLEPQNPAPALLLGRAYAAGGRQDDAVKILAGYVQQVPKHDEARKDLAQALAAAGRVAPAIDEINAYLQARPNDPEAQEARLQWMISLGRQAAAGRIYGEAAAANPNDAFAHYLAGIACTGTEDGVTHLRRAVELAPSDRKSWERLAHAQSAIGRKGLAVEAMTKAFEIAPASAAEITLVEEWRAATPPVVPPPAPPVPAGPTPTLADRVGEMRRALGRADFRATRRALESARAELSGREAQRNLALWAAIVDFEEGHLREAQDGFAALDANASYLGFGAGAVTNFLARTHLARGDVRGAITVLDQVGPEHPDEYAAARLWEGIALSALGMDELASRTWARLTEDAGGKVGQSGLAAVKSAEFLAGALAEKDYRTAVAPVEDFENDMHFVLGWAARSADRDAARAHFREAVESSHGREFPYHLAQAQLGGSGIGGK